MSKIQSVIADKFSDLKWRKKNLKNECSARRDTLEFHNSQKFIHDFFKPSNKQKGILSYHTVGSGKTATAVYTASGFENGYQIIWVTHFKLRNAMWKNIFGAMSAHPAMRNFQGTLPRSIGAKKRKFNSLTNKNWVPPVTYRQFSNALHKKNEFGKKLYKRNIRDPLYKTLLIVDEAHNLYNKDLGPAQRPDLDIITKMINKSYQKSGDNSVKVLLLSATPVTNDIIGFSKMINLMIPFKSKKLETNLDKFLHKYFTHDFTNLSRAGQKAFKDLGKYISYLNISGDANIFAQPKMILKSVSLTGSDKDLPQLKKLLDDLRNEKKDIKNKCGISKVNKHIKEFIDMPLPADIKVKIFHNNFPDFSSKDIKVLLNDKDVKDSCKEIKGRARAAEKKACNAAAKQALKEAKANLKVQAKTCKDTKTASNKASQDEAKENIKKFKKSQKNMIQLCDKKRSKNKQLECIQKNSIWAGPLSRNLRFESTATFFAHHAQFNTEMEAKAPKLTELLANIEKLDTADERKDGHLYKHIIFMNNKGYSGIKTLISALMANDYNFQLEPVVRQRVARRGRRQGQRVTSVSLRIPPTIRNDDYNFMALTGGSMYGASMTKTLTKQIIETVNDRTNNTHGRKVRFIIIDRNFLEGIDLFDVKYLHILDPYLFSTEMIQLIGRGTRTCGQAGLEFRNGWTLDVIKYNSTLDGESFEKKIKDKRMEVMQINEKVLKARTLTDKALQNFAIDQGLTKPGRLAAKQKVHKEKQHKKKMDRLVKQFKRVQLTPRRKKQKSNSITSLTKKFKNVKL